MEIAQNVVEDLSREDLEAEYFEMVRYVEGWIRASSNTDNNPVPTPEEYPWMENNMSAELITPG